MKCLRHADGKTLQKAGHATIQARPATLFLFAPVVDEVFLTERPVEAFSKGNFAHVPVLFGCVMLVCLPWLKTFLLLRRSNTGEDANWSGSLSDPSANTSEANSTETTVFNFLRGQFASLTKESFQKAVKFYPLADYDKSYSKQGQKMYAEMRYICTAQLITGGANKAGVKSFGYQCVNFRCSVLAMDLKVDTETMTDMTILSLDQITALI